MNQNGDSFLQFLYMCLGTSRKIKSVISIAPNLKMMRKITILKSPIDSIHCLIFKASFSTTSYLLNNTHVCIFFIFVILNGINKKRGIKFQLFFIITGSTGMCGHYVD